MNAADLDRIEDAKHQLRAAILFRNWRDVRLALEALEDVVGPDRRTAFAASRGGCEFCPSHGGGCCVCGGGRN